MDIDTDVDVDVDIDLDAKGTQKDVDVDRYPKLSEVSCPWRVPELFSGTVRVNQIHAAWAPQAALGCWEFLANP